MKNNPGFLFAVCSVLAAFGTACGGGTNTNRDAGGDAARRPPMTTAPAVRTVRGATAPMGATSMGMMSRPPIATGSTVTVPVNNAEVFQFQCMPEGVTSPIMCHWAYDSANMRNYIWWTQSTTCASTSAAADAAVLVEVNADGSGGFLLGSTCPDINLAGCQFTATGDLGTCGACNVAESGLITCL